MNRRRIPAILIALALTLALAVVLAIDAKMRHEPLLKVQVTRQTWCPSPEMRASIPVPLEDIPPRGADVTPIVGASSMDPAELAEAVNRLIAQVNPAVAVRSVSLSWPAGSGDAVLVVAWERAR
ncbi:hypothetical protein P12x_003014 [Tundrisphaera lichenicola]|uniref:hypothetical protein n=1 Tax=Tundrisphaera lichenicola TaxID=2029860 RepID=UPI003EB6A8D7